MKIVILNKNDMEKVFSIKDEIRPSKDALEFYLKGIGKIIEFRAVCFLS